MSLKKETWYYDSRRGGYTLHAFDELFKRGRGELRFHHYKASIVISGGESVWLYEAQDFDKLIALIKRAKRACLAGPVLKDQAAFDRRQARRRAAYNRKRRLARKERSDARR